MSEAMKKPAGGAWGVFLADKRAQFQKEVQAGPGDKSVAAVTKLASAKWKALSEKEKAPFEKKYQEKLEKYKAYKESDDYVAPEKKEKKGKDGKKAKDKDAPKKPAGGAYGVFFQEKREEFTKQAAAAGDKSFGAGAKLASAAWKEIGEKEKAKYEEGYQARKEQYDKDMAAYKASKADNEADEAEGASDAAPSPAPAKGAKRKADSPKEAKAKATPKKKAKTEPPTEPIKLDPAVLKEADGLGYRSQLENLAGRRDLMAKGVDSPKMLRALKAAGGLVNKAKAALLGA